MTGDRDLGLDRNNAHVQPDGTYHYHALPTGIVNQFANQNKPILIGYAADGFPIYAPHGYRVSDDPDAGMTELRSSYAIKTGSRPASGPGGKHDGTYTQDYEFIDGYGDLGECNGRTGVTPEYPEGTYYYVITNKFPYIPRCWVGDPDATFFKSPPVMSGNTRGRNSQRSGMRGGSGQSPMMSREQSGQRRGPPQFAIDACADSSQGSSCEVETPHGKLNGQCRQVPSGEVACVPEGHRRR